VLTHAVRGYRIQQIGLYESVGIERHELRLVTRTTRIVVKWEARDLPDGRHVHVLIQLHLKEVLAVGRASSQADRR
jgi:hypothetical protein